MLRLRFILSVLFAPGEPLHRKLLMVLLTATMVYFVSCGQKKNNTPVSLLTPDSKHRYFTKKPESYYYNYNDSLSEIENFDTGYTDSFSVRGTQFRLLADPDTAGNIVLQVNKNGGWLDNLRIDIGPEGYSAESDLNLDGYNDFQNALLRGTMFYLFDTMKREYHTVPVYLAFEWTMIDSAKKLFCNYYSTKGLSYTNLFSLEGLKQHYLYTAQVEPYMVSKKERIRVRLYKINNNDLQDTVFVQQRIYDPEMGEFDAVEYWRRVMKIQNPKPKF